MTEAALPLIEALAALREEAVAMHHDMAPAEWYKGVLISQCIRCGNVCVAYRQDGEMIKKTALSHKLCRRDRLSIFGKATL